MSNKIIILTGEIQAGKTTLLQQFCRQQKNTAGILTPIVNATRMFYDISGNNFFAMEALENEEQLAIGKHLFSAKAFTKATAILSNANKNIELKYLIIDEIGPLEVKQQKGLYQSFKEILSSNFAYTLIVVIRQGLVEEAIKHFDLTEPMVLSIAEMKKHFEINF
jgi:nucleoside-triphosphatase THEP1